jgi:plastocyanin
MLNSYSAKAGALAALLCAATTAQAADHVVLIVDGAYFPLVTYAAPGDTLVFTNTLETEQQVTGAGDVWTSGPIPQDQSFSLQLSDEVPATFYGTGPESEVFEGTFTFEAAPS